MFSQIALFLMILKVQAEISSLPHLKEFRKTEEIIKAVVDDYVYKEQEKIDKFIRYFQSFDVRIKNEQLDVEGKITNPLSTYALISRLFKFAEEVLPAIKDDAKRFEELLSKVRSLSYPSDEDVTEALGTALKLQRVYNLSSEDLAKGKILGKKYGEVLTPSLCYKLGELAGNTSYFWQAVDWLKIAKEKLESSNEIDTSKMSVNLHLVESFYKTGNYGEGLELLDEALKANPTNPDYLKYKKDFEEVMQKESSEIFKNTTGDISFEDLCKNNILSKTKSSHLKCFYKFKEHPFLRITPFKVERISYEPNVDLFHNVLSDDEILILKEISFQKLQTFTIRNKHSIRTGTSAFIYENTHGIIPVISQRIADITGLTVNPKEPLQITHYGVGGFYVPHVDFFKEEYKENFNLNDSVATVAFYLTDVEYGGVTIFPISNTTVSPKKGTAFFWRNLDRNGKGDTRTLHGECPVLLGSKWVATKFLSESDQTFGRSCKNNYVIKR